MKHACEVKTMIHMIKCISKYNRNDVLVQCLIKTFTQKLFTLFNDSTSLNLVQLTFFVSLGLYKVYLIHYVLNLINGTIQYTDTIKEL